MDTDSLYLALAETDLYDCILSEKKQEWESLRSKDSNDSFTADDCNNFFPRISCAMHKQHDKRQPALFREEIRCIEMLCLCSKTYCCYDSLSNKFKLLSKRPNNCKFEDCGDKHIAKDEIEK